MPRADQTTADPTGVERLWSTTVGEDLAFLLARANALSLAGVTQALAPHELKVRAYSVLALAASDARPSQRELSEFLRLDPSQIVALIDDLESRGLAQRESDPRDRRANVVTITSAGRRSVTAARDSASESEAETFGALSDAERETLRTLLRKLAAAPAGS